MLPLEPISDRFPAGTRLLIVNDGFGHHIEPGTTVISTGKPGPDLQTGDDPTCPVCSVSLLVTTRDDIDPSALGDDDWQDATTVYVLPDALDVVREDSDKSHVFKIGARVVVPADATDVQRTVAGFDVPSDVYFGGETTGTVLGYSEHGAAVVRAPLIKPAGDYDAGDLVIQSVDPACLHAADEPREPFGPAKIDAFVEASLRKPEPSSTEVAVRPLTAGDRVVVPADAKTVDGAGVYFGREVRGAIFIEAEEGDGGVFGIGADGRPIYQWVALDALRLDSDYPEPQPGDLLTITGHADPDLNGSAEFVSRKVDEYTLRPLFGPKAGRATSVRAIYVREG